MKVKEIVEMIDFEENPNMRYLIGYSTGPEPVSYETHVFSDIDDIPDMILEKRIYCMWFNQVHNVLMLEVV